MHQTVEQGRLTLERLTTDFGPAIAKLVESTTRLDIIGNFHQQGTIGSGATIGKPA
ncbi:MAG: hypothetical protein R3F37_04685 [Candidatus Competibacteraceae bacterium]